MQDIPHIVEVAFQASALMVGIAYAALWGSGRKLTNRQALFAFAIGFALMLSLNLLSSIMPTWWLLVLVAASWSVKPLKKLLTKPASQNKMIPVRKPSALPERSDLSD
jgi:glucose-6-phosphate-specific signal transduction histidine kinase